MLAGWSEIVQKKYTNVQNEQKHLYLDFSTLLQCLAYNVIECSATFDDLDPAF